MTLLATSPRGRWRGEGRQSDWVCTDASASALHGVEYITEGRDRCVDIPFAAAISDEGALEYHASSHGMDAFAGLTRATDAEGE